jgi:7-cyano-7-deazaguanine synthase
VKKEQAVVLVSGGMDSCVTAAIAKLTYNLTFLHLDYGQKTQQRERKSFLDIADYYKVQKKMIVNVNHFSQIGGSSLTDERMVITASDLDSEEIPPSYVPFRNANILAIATSWAEVIGASKIFIGAVEEDSSGYPDCRESFFRAFNEAINKGTKPDTLITIMTPLIHMSKKQIVEKAFELAAPLHLTWSCYKNEDIACGICDSCALRLRGFQEAEKKDPILYVTQPDCI